MCLIVIENLSNTTVSILKLEHLFYSNTTNKTASLFLEANKVNDIRNTENYLDVLKVDIIKEFSFDRF